MKRGTSTGTRKTTVTSRTQTEAQASHMTANMPKISSIKFKSST